jgi:hypothetical protein
VASVAAYVGSTMHWRWHRVFGEVALCEIDFMRDTMVIV